MISIIIPTFNSNRFLTDTIDSVISQDYNNWELIVIDDYSSDNTRCKIADYAKKDSRIKPIFLNANYGTAYARNQGLKYAKGNFIAFLDSDDIWYPNKLSTQVAFMIKNKCPISFTSYEVFSVESKKNYIINAVSNLDYSAYLKNTIIGCSTAIVNRNIVGDFSFREDMRTRQDTKLWLTLLKKGFIANGIKQVLVKYRIHDGSISKNKFKAALKVWNLYFNVEKLGFLKSIYYFGYYAKNAILKRL